VAGMPRIEKKKSCRVFKIFFGFFSLRTNSAAFTWWKKPLVRKTYCSETQKSIYN